ncbi:MAG TPA: hypothetical protein DEA55_05095 [Rhodospirillaceae bacterium]|nr:hypothetical protein [Rhodospirillaceae bacterium]
MPESPTARPIQTSIVSPVADFLMVGGLTFVIFAISYLPIWDTVPKEFLRTAGFYLTFVLNFPHFIHGYQLLYEDYGRKISDIKAGMASRIRYIIAGIVSPLALIAFLAYGAMQPTVQIIGYAANAMLFLVGWHYVKQGYGILMMLSVRKKVFFDNIEKRILLANAYIVWLFSWLHLNFSIDRDVFHDIPVTMLDVPPQIMGAANAALIVWTIGIAVFLVKKFDRLKTLSFNGFTAYACALYGWVLFAFINPLALIFIPALHSLQYLLFVWKLAYEKTRESVGGAARSVFKDMLPFLAVGFTGGLVFFYLLPTNLDKMELYDVSIFGPQLFMFMFMIFLNVHHYFIDFAIWRRENPELQYLFR